MNIYQGQFIIPLTSLRQNEDGLPVIQLLPDGKFRSIDGRPGNMDKCKAMDWLIDGAIAKRLIKKWQERSTALAIDYEHQTLNAEKNGQPAPAGGWVENIFYEAGKGLFATVNWTSAAKGYIERDEYRYISPVFKFDPKTGAVLELKGAALTNTPALDGMDAVKAKQNTEDDMDLKEIKKRLGLADAADESTILTALTEKMAELDALKKQELSVPLSIFKPLVEQVSSLKEAVLALSNKSSQDDLDKEIDNALKDGRLLKTQEAWARLNAKKSPEIISAFLKEATPITALNKLQTGGKEPDGTQAAALSDDEKYVCTQLGISHTDYASQKQKETK